MSEVKTLPESEPLSALIANHLARNTMYRVDELNPEQIVALIADLGTLFGNTGVLPGIDVFNATVALVCEQCGAVDFVDLCEEHMVELALRLAPLFGLSSFVPTVTVFKLIVRLHLKRWYVNSVEDLCVPQTEGLILVLARFYGAVEIGQPESEVNSDSHSTLLSGI